MTALQVYNLVRALNRPFPNAFSFYKNTKLTFQKVRLSKIILNIKTGEFLKKKKKVFVKCKKGYIEILQFKGTIPNSGKFESIN